MYTAADVDQLTARAGLAPARRQEIQAAATALRFRVTSYVTDELIDWSAVPDDPIYRLVFPDPDMLRKARASESPGPAARPGQASAGVQPASESPVTCHRHTGEPVLPGVRHRYHDTVSVLLPAGPAGSFGITLPGMHWPGPEPEPPLAAAGLPRLAGYLTAHPEVSIAELTGADPLSMGTRALGRYLEPLLTAEHLVSIRLRTSALARWPYRFLAGPDADELLHLVERVIAAGKSLAVLAEWSHPRELEPAPAREAMRRLCGTGATVYSHGKLAGTVNDAPGIWSGMWRTQVRLGMIPRTMLLPRVTGPAQHYRVTLARAQNIFAGAYGSMTGLARTSPSSGHWIKAAFRGQDATLERLRADRQLEEALTHGADPLHLAAVFGLDPTTAIRYATAARQLLRSPIERDAED